MRVSEGRAKKIEGNPDHPVNRGKLCARGQAILQELYHPDRVAQPLKRSGPRGSGEFTRISWEEGLRILTSKLEELQQEKATDRLALVTPQLRGTLATLTTGFMRSFGSPHHLSYELLGSDWLRAANRQSFGQPSLPYYDLAETRYLLSFGADFVETHLSPVQYGYAFGRMRQGRDTVRGHFTYVGGRLSLTGASADRWLPARPGSEGALALGMARLILAESLFDKAALAANGLRAEQLLARLAAYDLPRVAELTGLTKESIAEVAREFATTRPALAMAGETVAFQTNGPEAVRAVQLLNLLAGNLNRPGGVYPDGGSPAGPELLIRRTALPGRGDAERPYQGGPDPGRPGPCHTRCHRFPGGARQGSVHRQLLLAAGRHRPAGRPDPSGSRRAGELGGRDPAGRRPASGDRPDAAGGDSGFRHPPVPRCAAGNGKRAGWGRWRRHSPTNPGWRC